METQLVIFLAFTSVTLITNTLVIVFAYKAFANVTTKVTNSMQELQNDEAVRQWIRKMQATSESAVSVTSHAKERVQEFDPVLERMQARHSHLLVDMNQRAEGLGDRLVERAKTMRDSVARPAYSVGAFAAGLHSVLELLETPEEEDIY